MVNFEEYSAAEFKWLSYPSNREFHLTFSEFIISNSIMKNEAKYMGAYYIPLNNSFAAKYTATNEIKENLDIIYLDNLKKFKNTKKFGVNQSKFQTFDDFAENRKPPKDKYGFYFFGELHDENGFIHWNLCITDPFNNQIMFFDPVLDSKSINEEHESLYQQYYDFTTRKIISSAFGENFGKNYTLILPSERPQHIADSKRNDVDIFCQTWCLLFLDIFCNKKIDTFLQIPFSVYRTEVVKVWVYKTLKKFNKAGKDNEWNIFKSSMMESFTYKLSLKNKKMQIEPFDSKLGELLNLF